MTNDTGNLYLPFLPLRSRRTQNAFAQQRAQKYLNDLLREQRAPLPPPLELPDITTLSLMDE
jgi:hypothetical protein